MRPSDRLPGGHRVAGEPKRPSIDLSTLVSITLRVSPHTETGRSGEGPGGPGSRRMLRDHRDTKCTWHWGGPASEWGEDRRGPPTALLLLGVAQAEIDKGAGEGVSAAREN